MVGGGLRGPHEAHEEMPQVLVRIGTMRGRKRGFSTDRGFSRRPLFNNSGLRGRLAYCRGNDEVHPLPLAKALPRYRREIGSNWPTKRPTAGRAGLPPGTGLFRLGCACASFEAIVGSSARPLWGAWPFHLGHGNSRVYRNSGTQRCRPRKIVGQFGGNTPGLSPVKVRRLRSSGSPSRCIGRL
jgi:hypothetical protein